MQSSLIMPATLPGSVAPMKSYRKNLFLQIKLFLNGNLVRDSGYKYAYRSFWESELTYNTDTEMSHLQSSTYFFDDKPESDDNSGFVQRVSFLQCNTIVKVTAPVHFELFSQERFFINYTDGRLEQIRNTYSFAKKPSCV